MIRSATTDEFSLADREVLRMSAGLSDKAEFFVCTCGGVFVLDEGSKQSLHSSPMCPGYSKAIREQTAEGKITGSAIHQWSGGDG